MFSMEVNPIFIAKKSVFTYFFPLSNHNKSNHRCVLHTLTLKLMIKSRSALPEDQKTFILLHSRLLISLEITSIVDDYANRCINVFWCFSGKKHKLCTFSGRDGVGNGNHVQVSWHLWSNSVMPTVKIGALFCPKYIKTSIIFSGNARSFRGLRPLDPHQGLAPGPHRGPKAGPWTPPVMGFAPRRSPCTLCVHQIF